MASNVWTIAPQIERSATQIDTDAGVYTLVGTFTHLIRMIEIYNFTDTVLQFSIDGLIENLPATTKVDHFIVPPNTGTIKDITANKGRASEQWSTENGIQIFVKFRTTTPDLTDPDAGVYISGYFARGE